jgi:hypothetical protein
MRAVLLCSLLASSIAIAKPTPEAFPGADLPDVTRTQDKLGASSGVIEREKGAKLVVGSPKGISVDGRLIVKIDQGAVDPAEKEGGANGMKIPKLAAALPGSDAVEIALDGQLTYKLLVETIYSAKLSGRTKLSLLVRAGGAVVAVPIAIPAAVASASGPSPGGTLGLTKTKTKAKKADLPLGMIVSVSKSELLVWSFSGTEGTIQKPRLRVALDNKAGGRDRRTRSRSC